MKKNIIIKDTVTKKELKTAIKSFEESHKETVLSAFVNYTTRQFSERGNNLQIQYIL